MVGVLNDSGEQRFLDRTRCMTYSEIRETHLSLDSGFLKNYIATKAGHDELVIKLLKNITHSLEVDDLRYSLNRAKTLSLLQVVSGAATLEKLGE